MIIDIQTPTPEMLASDGNQRYVDFEQYIDSNKIYYIELGFTYSLDVNISKVVGKLLNFKYGVCECEIWNNTAESLCDISNCCIVPMGKGKILPAGDVTDYTLLKFNFWIRTGEVCVGLLKLLFEFTDLTEKRVLSGDCWKNCV